MCRHRLLKWRAEKYLLSMMRQLGDWRTLTGRCDLEFLFSGNREAILCDLPCRDGPLAVDPLPLDSVRVLQAHYIFEIIYAFICDKPESSRLPGPFIFQNGAILNLTILYEVLLEFLVTQVVWEAPNEYLPELVIERGESNFLRRRSRIRLLDIEHLALIHHGRGGLGAASRLGQVLREILKVDIGRISLLVSWRGTRGRLTEPRDGRCLVGIITEILKLTLIRLLGLQ